LAEGFECGLAISNGISGKHNLMQCGLFVFTADVFADPQHIARLEQKTKRLCAVG